MHFRDDSRLWDDARDFNDDLSLGGLDDEWDDGEDEHDEDWDEEEEDEEEA